MGAEAPQDVVELAQRRARARAEKDFAAADRLRDLIADAGWAVTDTPGGFELQPTTGDGPAGPVVADEVASVIEEPPTAEVSVQWVCEGWPEDIERALASFRANAGDRAVQYVVADVTGEPDGRWEAWNRFLAGGGRTLTQSRLVVLARREAGAVGR